MAYSEGGLPAWFLTVVHRMIFLSVFQNAARMPAAIAVFPAPVDCQTSRPRRPPIRAGGLAANILATSMITI